MFSYLLIVCNHWPLEGFRSGFTVNEGLVVTLLSAMWRVSDSPQYNVLWTTGVLQSFVLFGCQQLGLRQSHFFFLLCSPFKTASTKWNKENLSNSLEMGIIWCEKQRKSLVTPYFLFTLFKQERRKKGEKLDSPLVLRSNFGKFTEALLLENMYSK